MASQETEALIDALEAVGRHVPRVVEELRSETMLPAKQRELADLLAGLGTLLGEHAELPTGVPPVTSQSTARPGVPPER